MWSSDAPQVVAVAAGRLIAGRPGRATVTAQGGPGHADDGGHGVRRIRRRRSRSSPRRRRYGPATWSASPSPRGRPGAGRARTRRRSGASRPGNAADRSRRRLRRRAARGPTGSLATFAGRTAEAVVEVRAARCRAGPPRWWAGCRSRSRRRSSGSTRTGSTATSPPWATGSTRSTSAIPASPVDHRLGRRGRAAHQRPDDDRGRQVRGAHPGGRLDPQERHRDPLVRGPGPSQGDRRVHRDGHRRRAQHVHLSRATSISPTTRPARCG